jgi:hypothetical protein
VVDAPERKAALAVGREGANVFGFLVGHVMSALMGIPRLRSMSFLYLNALLRSLSICFPQVLLMSTHRFSMISVINVVTNWYSDPQGPLVEADLDSWVYYPWAFPRVNPWWSMSYPDSWHALSQMSGHLGAILVNQIGYLSGTLKWVRLWVMLVNQTVYLSDPLKWVGIWVQYWWIEWGIAVAH